MLSVLIEGTLIAAPVRRTSAKGGAFVTAQVRCSADDGASVFCGVIAFQPAAAEALAALGAGDAVAVAGPASLSQWEKDGEHRSGLRVTATRVLSVYDAGARRRAAGAAHEPREGRERREARAGGPIAPAGPRPADGRGATPPRRRAGFDDLDDDRPV